MSKLPDDYQKKLDEWKKTFKDKWDYNKKLIVYGDGKGNIFTPTTTTTTTPNPVNTTTTWKPFNSSVPDVTKFTPKPVVNITMTPNTGPLSQADATNMIKVVLITIFSILAVIVVVALIIGLCRRSKRKKDQRISLRRPLHPEADDHIYAEIEPLQAQRSASPSGSSSGGVVLPVRKDQRKKSHVRALSTRLYRFFNLDHSDSEDHANSSSVAFNTSSMNASIIDEVPHLPGRNVANGNKMRKGRGVRRGESTASQRPLLDGESMRSSGGAEMRDNIYNPLIRNSENRASGPYEHLAGRARDSTERSSSASATEEPVEEAPHDYFTLANEKRTDDSIGGENKEDDEKRVISTIQESDEEVDEPVKKHDYFVLEPHQREDMLSEGKSVSHPQSPSRTSLGSLKSKSTSNPSSPIKDSGDKPKAKPRVTKTGDSALEAGKDEGEAGKNKTDAEVKEGVKKLEDGEKTNDAVKANTADNEDDPYVLGKLGDAPEPPEVQLDDDYMTPSECESRPDYCDVFPEVPPRSTSLRTDEILEAQHEKKSIELKKTQNDEDKLTVNVKPECQKVISFDQEKVKTGSPAVVSPKRETLKLKTSTETDV